MLSHHSGVSQQFHREHVQRLTADAQHPMQSVSLPSHGFGLSHVLARLAAFAHLSSVPHHRGVDVGS